MHKTNTPLTYNIRPIISRLFGKMSDEIFNEISQMFVWSHFQSDECIFRENEEGDSMYIVCLLYTSPSPRDQRGSRMPSSA